MTILGRGFLAGTSNDVNHLPDNDLRATIARPRFEPDAFAQNKQLLVAFEEVAKTQNCTMAQLALAWLLNRENRTMVPIPGTRVVQHMKDNVASAAIELDMGTINALDTMINESTVVGQRYTAERMASADCERDVVSS